MNICIYIYIYIYIYAHIERETERKRERKKERERERKREREYLESGCWMPWQAESARGAAPTRLEPRPPLLRWECCVLHPARPAEADSIWEIRG